MQCNDWHWFYLHIILHIQHIIWQNAATCCRFCQYSTHFNQQQNQDENVMLNSRLLHWFGHVILSTHLVSSWWSLQPVKVFKTKNLKKSHLLLIFLVSANALLAETGGGNINLQVSMLDCMDFYSFNWLSCIKSENQLVSIFSNGIIFKWKYWWKSVAHWACLPS
jgi:hypothetical protein